MHITKNILSFLFVVVFLVSPSGVYAKDQLLFEGDSPYTGIQIYDKDDGLRYMQFGVYDQTIMLMADPTYLHYDYVRTIMAGFAFTQKPVKKILLMGLGGGTIAHFISAKFPEADIDIFEIDPLVIELAQKYFKFEPGKHGKVTVGDGRRVLRKSPEMYDLIILDAYKAGGIPFHLTTREFMSLVKDHLNPDGVAVVHLWAEYANKYLQAQVKTIADVFPRNYSFYDSAGSFMIFATKHKEWMSKDVVSKRGDEISKKRKFSFNLKTLIDKQYIPGSQIPTSGLAGQILTDDFAPVNLLKHQGPK